MSSKNWIISYGIYHCDIIRNTEYFCILTKVQESKERRKKIIEVRNSWVTNLSYEIELCKTTSRFELLTRKFLQKFFFRVTSPKPKNKNLHFELLTLWVKFYLITFKLITRNWKIKFHFVLLTRNWKIESCTSSY